MEATVFHNFSHSFTSALFCKLTIQCSIFINHFIANLLVCISLRQWNFFKHF